jgi:hypothetical protein
MPNILRLLQRAIKNPSLVANKLLKKLGKPLSDKQYARLQYRFVTGKKLNLANPTTYNEKIQWLKVYGFKPEYTQMADKYLARECIIERLRTHFENPEQFLVPLLGVWDMFDDIDFDTLPEQFVLKTNHDSGTVVICDDKQRFDKATARDKLTKSLKRNFYWGSREPCYKDIEPKIIAEELLGTNIYDYKFFCFDGKCRAIQVDLDRFTDHRRNLYSPNWELLPLSFAHPNAHDVDVPKPERLDEMLSIAEDMSKGMPHLRVDFYCPPPPPLQSQVFIGELTFYPENGIGELTPGSWSTIFGDWIHLPQ